MSKKDGKKEVKEKKKGLTGDLTSPWKRQFHDVEKIDRPRNVNRDDS